MAKKGIYRFYWDCGRMGDVSGVFVATDKQVKDIQGKHIYFGEILGKHSEVYGDISDKDITLLTDDKTAVEVVDKYDLSNGYNPFEYLEEGDEDED